MPTLLQIDSSPMQAGRSFSRQLTQEFAQRWQESNPNGTIVTRDLTFTPLFALDAQWIGAAYTPEANRTAEQRQALALSDELIAELESADEIVLGVPMHNFSIPGTLKLWIDQIARAGKTFSYTSAGPAGLLKNKKATLILASGGVYEAGTPMASFDFAEPYLKRVLEFIGIADVHVIRAAGTSKAQDPVARETLLGTARAAMREKLQAA